MCHLQVVLGSDVLGVEGHFQSKSGGFGSLGVPWVCLSSEDWRSALVFCRVLLLGTMAS